MLFHITGKAQGNTVDIYSKTKRGYTNYMNKNNIAIVRAERVKTFDTSTNKAIYINY